MELKNMTEPKNVSGFPKQTIAEKIQFQLQFMGIMKMCGRDDEADVAYIKAQELTMQLVESEKVNA